MDYVSSEEIFIKAKQICPISNDELKRLLPLVMGVKESTTLLENLIQPLHEEINIDSCSKTVNGDEV
ncbi:MAG: hypothetical protein CL887_03975 [Dehalococcoidia bacterium]|nr:hypothetical protein [Dehalococcoidia bacterium]|tara:strand:- start:301 stop:501 length:201 start_codon:yes stop_codon:yes gene_type:complete